MRIRMLALLTLGLIVTSLSLTGCQQKAKEEAPPPTEQASPEMSNSADIYARAEAAHMAGRYDEAAALLRDFPAGTPETAMAHNLLGLTYARLGNPGLAEVEFQAALAADPNLKNANYNLAVLRLSDNRLEQAESGFQAALKSDPYFAPAHQGLAEVYRRSGKTADAKAEDKIAAELAAKQPPAGTGSIADLDVKSIAVGDMAEAPKTSSTPKPAATKPKPAAPPKPTTVEVQLSAPTGTAFNVVLGAPLSSANTMIGQEISGTVASAVKSADGDVIIPAGAPVKGRVTAAKASGRVKGRAELGMAFTSVQTVAGWRDIDAPMATVQAEGTKKQDAAKIGIGAAAGAVLGEVIGGSAGKGAVIGGAAGTGLVLATKGKEVELAAGAEVPVALAAPLAVTITKTVAPK
jgi:Tfp pilus assembly protein PilF